MDKIENKGTFEGKKPPHDQNKEIIRLLKTMHKSELRGQAEMRRVWLFEKKIGVLLACACPCVVFLAYLFLSHPSTMTYGTPDGYLLENLQGDAINTWVSWDLVPGDTLQVNIVNSAGLSGEKIGMMKSAILSNSSVLLDDSLFQGGMNGTSVYYSGWEGALHSLAGSQTKFYIPQSFQVSELPDKVGDITIHLVRDESPDGLSGNTRNIVDHNQILSSMITIYQADNLSNGQLVAITRHEFGHALGLSHSDAPYDLMHAKIETEYPYISSCDAEAVLKLYSGLESSQVICDR